MLSPDIKERIFKAANELYAAHPDEFPSVEAVRQASRAGMQNVVEALKEWRQKQRQQVQAVREPLPAGLLPVVQGVGLTIWEAAQELANEKLDAARAAFEAEKQDYVAMSAEQSAAYEAQAQLLEQTQQRVASMEQAANDAAAREQMTADELADHRKQLADASQGLALAEQRAAEVEHRAQELRTELDRAHVDAQRQREAHDAAQLKASASIEQLTAKLAAVDQQRIEAQERADTMIAELRQDVATLRVEAQAHQREAAAATQRATSAEADRETARVSAAQAREEAASLRGQLEASNKQGAALLASLKPSSGKAGGKAGGKQPKP